MSPSYIHKNSFNHVTLIGHVGADPKISYTDAGHPLTKVTLATHEIIRGETYKHWHTVAFWGTLAETAVKYVKKGYMLGIIGRIHTNKRGEGTFTEVEADQITFFGAKHSEIEDE